MTANENKAKTMTKHISCDCNANSVIQRVIQIKNGIIKHVNASAKITPHEKKNCSWNPSTCIYENSKYLESLC